MALIGFTWIRSDFCGSTRVLRVVLGVPPKTGFKGIPSPVKLTLTQSALKPTLPAVRRSARPARTPLRAASCNERVQICCVAWSFNQQRATFNPSPPRGYVKEPPEPATTLANTAYIVNKKLILFTRACLQNARGAAARDLGPPSEGFLIYDDEVEA